MAKIDKSTYPANHGPSDFSCKGPVASKDGEFDGVYMADMGCFNQDGKDSNKAYLACVAKSKLTGKHFLYTTWGRTGGSSWAFQFEEFDSESAAQAAFAAQCHSKNDKRGVWSTVAGIRTLTAKPGKDVYKVQSLRNRTVGLPDGRNITNEAGPIQKVTKTSSSKRSDVQPEVRSLLRDLNVGTVAYTRSSLEGGNVPAQSAIDFAREVLEAAKKRLVVVGMDVDHQVTDKELRQLSYEIYSRIPKKKALHVGDKEWILNQTNIVAWNQDLDAFESAGFATTAIEEDSDPYGGMPVTLEYLPESSEIGRFIREWAPNASANRHANIGRMKIKNVWAVRRVGDEEKLRAVQQKCRVTGVTERPLFQPANRPDLSRDDLKNYVASNTCFQFHGTRSVNVSGILRESLRLPKTLVGVAISGAMMGSGIYGADDWRKSANYTSLGSGMYSSGGGGIRGRGAFMFIKDMVIGKAHVAREAYGYTQPPEGCHSVLGKAGHTRTWGSSTLMNNEWIVYSTDRVCLRYLIEFEA